MTQSVLPPSVPDPNPAAALLETEHADAERLLNGVRAIALVLLMGAAAVYAHT